MQILCPALGGELRNSELFPLVIKAVIAMVDY